MKAWAISCNTEKYSTIFGIINILIQLFYKNCMLFPWPTWRSHCCTKSSNLQALSNTQGYSHSMNMSIGCTQNWLLKWVTNTHEYYSIEYELNNWVRVWVIFFSYVCSVYYLRLKMVIACPRIQRVIHFCKMLLSQIILWELSFSMVYGFWPFDPSS